MRYMARCSSPFRKLYTNKIVDLPCGKCYACKARRTSGWSFRLMQEFKRCTSAHFVTLTYDPLHVPLSENGFMTLDKRDCQLFMKNLRNTYRHEKDPPKIKYYLVGEYGSRTSRPHYHAIIFNAATPDDIMRAWRYGVDFHFGKVSEASVGYTLKYMSKPATIGKFGRDDRVKEFSLCSRGLGDNYIDDAVFKWHRADLTRMYAPLKDGKKIALPRYYRTKLYTSAEVDAFAEKMKKENDETSWLDREKDYLRSVEQDRRLREDTGKRDFL